MEAKKSKKIAKKGTTKIAIYFFATKTWKSTIRYCLKTKDKTPSNQYFQHYIIFRCRKKFYLPSFLKFLHLSRSSAKQVDLIVAILRSRYCSLHSSPGRRLGSGRNGDWKIGAEILALAKRRTWVPWERTWKKEFFYHKIAITNTSSIY